jgi:hypothetical protein
VLRIETTVGGTLTDHVPSWHWLGKSLEVRPAKLLISEQIPQQTMRALGDDHASGRGKLLQPRRKVRRLANDGLLLRSPRADQVANDHKARCDADASL